MAPFAIQVFRIAFSSADNGFFGGISPASTRVQSGLSSGFPATTAGPFFVPLRSDFELVRSSPPFGRAPL
jgi:hypothetical protein